uniref:CA domain-containing protein n=1 Tax=Rhabditophanes sp. KR3021 TaxID=114890 RepID=A0AC35UCY8_9BILA
MAIQINDITGEISVLKELDYETKAKFVFLAIPTDGSISSRNIILVTDENDNSPTFPVDHITLEISEYAQLNTQLALPLASDPDSDKYSIQKYVLVGGNVNNVFRLSSRTLSDVIYVDLVVNGQLDREYRSRYELTIEAVDGGNPSKSGRLNATVLIIDVNDNLPEFSKSKYYATIHSNASIDDNVLTVKATDLDEGENGRVSYKIIENNDKSSRKFKIDEDSGVIKVAEQGSFIAGAVYEILLSVEDHGFPQKLENSVFVQIKIAKELNNFEANLDIVWLTDDGLPQLYENVTIGYIFARISVKDMLPENELILTGNESFCLRQSDKIDVFLLVVCGSLDREQKSTQKNYHIKMIDGIDEIYEIVAHDIDFGNNSRIVYSIIGTDLFSINNDSGVITKNKELDCNAGAEISFKVKAVDMGEPKQSSFANVIIDITALNSKPPLFEKSLYEIEISEDTKMGTCFIKVNDVNKHLNL